MPALAADFSNGDKKLGKRDRDERHASDVQARVFSSFFYPAGKPRYQCHSSPLSLVRIILSRMIFTALNKKIENGTAREISRFQTSKKKEKLPGDSCEKDNGKVAKKKILSTTNIVDYRVSFQIKTQLTPRSSGVELTFLGCKKRSNSMRSCGKITKKKTTPSMG